ncbi:MAG: methyltransferase domain-containing protein [Planctomycetales bacterium]|nr:methyltransferase domain-containing protein [Planctomycetales bacterium]
MITCATVKKQVIRKHYDHTSFFYRLLWGQHIHHGLWEGEESPRRAQLNLTRTVANAANIPQGARVLDVGCGLGGSSIYLAKQRECQVTGITLSPVQRRWAGLSSRWHRVSHATEFRCQDAESVEFAPDTFDVVWSIECTEHLFDKATFFRNAARWLRPGGKLAICAWLANEVPTESQSRQVYDVCEGFFCPSLGSRADYIGWIESAGLQMRFDFDWSDRVARTWDICLRRATATGMPWLAHCFDSDMVMFVQRFRTMIDAYRTGAMKYGCFIAECAAA